MITGYNGNVAHATAVGTRLSLSPTCGLGRKLYNWYICAIQLAANLYM